MPTRRRILRKFLPGVVAGLALLSALGFLYEARGRRLDAQRLPPIGQSVDIGGRTLLLNCLGSGAPAVVLDAGATTPGYGWIPIQRQLAPLSRTCWFDRAGEGWSDPGPFPLTSRADAQDLHAALHRAGVAPPYVLVGHSLGGLDVRVFAGLYPAEVGALVLVESAHEDEPVRAPPAYLGPRPPAFLWHPLHLLFTAAARFGLLRLAAPPIPAHLPPDDSVRAIVTALSTRPQAIASYSSRGLVGPSSYAAAHAVTHVGDIPLIVLTRGRLPAAPRSQADSAALAYELVWQHEMQPQLARLSPRGRQVILPCSGHGVPEDDPGAIIAAVREILMLPHDTIGCPLQ
ncbi:MAG TPA: alpha/beta hydrolase [Gemmatimonadales bacterium]|nr:alpha/beta hydrolase [Gemmatimonadales bacterium]